MLVIQFAKLLDRSRKLRSLDFPLRRPALGGVANKLQFVRLVDRHGTAPRSHGLKGQRATFLLAVLRLAITIAWSGPAFRKARCVFGNAFCDALVGKTMHAIG